MTRRIHPVGNVLDDDDEVADEIPGAEPRGDERIGRQNADALPDERVAVVERRQIDVLDFVGGGLRRLRRRGGRGRRCAGRRGPAAEHEIGDDREHDDATDRDRNERDARSATTAARI